MAFILSLETSADSCSVALHNNSGLVSERILREPQAHASRLVPLIDDLFSSTSTKPADIDAVAVSSGPGSYTGLRIGVSTAKGICFGLGIPLLSVPTLELLAIQGRAAIEDDAILCPMIDARRMEVYCQLFEPDLTPITEVEAKVIDTTSFSELLRTRKMFFFGPGAMKCAEVIIDENAVFSDSIVASASAMGIIAYRKFLEEKFEDTHSFKPFYLKEFVAKKPRSLID